MNSLLHDLRCAVRVMSRRPGLTLAALLTLAIGIGANTAIYSIVETVLIHPLPYRDGDRLVYLYQENDQWNVTTPPSADLVRACSEQAGSFEQVESYSTETFTLTGDGEAARLTGARVSPRFFSFLGVKMPLGRAFLPGEDSAGENRVAVLSQSLWQSRFGSDPGVLGRSLKVNGEPYLIVGVLPRSFRLEAYSEIRFWIPRVEENEAHGGDSGPLYAIARLAEGASVETAQAELDVISRRLDLREADVEWTGKVVTPQSRLGSRVRATILVLQAAVGFVLLIACANIANLLLAQGEARGKELAVRSVLGAGRGRLVRQLLTESLVMGLLGGAIGLLLSYWSIDTILSLLPEQLSHLNRIELNRNHVGFTLLVSVVTGIVFGLLPALRGSLPDLSDAMKQGGPSGGRRGSLLRQGLVGAEVASSLVLLIGAGLLLQTFLRLQMIDPGFAAGNLMTLRMELPEDRYPEGDRQAAFYDQVLDSTRELSPQQAEGVALTSSIGSQDLGVILGVPELEGHPAGAEAQRQMLTLVTASPGYFRTMGIPLRNGRGFTEQDREGSEPVVVVNETLVRRYFPGLDPVGQRIRFAQDWYRVIGVARDVLVPTADPGMSLDLQVYLPSRQRPRPAMTLAVRMAAGADPRALIDVLKARVRAIDPQVPISRVATADTLLAGAFAQQRFNAFLMVCFALTAMVLTTVGIYGVVAYSVNRRTFEIGVRMALGARVRDVLRHVISRGMLPVAIGTLIGLAGALALARILRGLVHEISVKDPVTFAAAALLVMAVALVTIWLAARQAARVDPMVALRHE